MDCNCNQWSAGSCRPQMPPPPCMNTNCGCGSSMPSMPSMPPMPPIQPRMGEPSYSMPLDRRMPDRGYQTAGGAAADCGMKPSCGMKSDCGMKADCGMKSDCGMKADCGMKPSCDMKSDCGMPLSDGIMPNVSGVQPSVCPANKASYLTDPINLPIAMAYVPWQKWRQTYPMDKAVVRGTIFPELDLPFVMGRCR